MQMTIDELFQLVHILVVDPTAGDVHEPTPGISREQLERLTDDYINDLVCWVRANGGMGQFAPHIVAMATLHACFARLYACDDMGGLITDPALALRIRGLFADAVGALACDEVI